MEITQEQYAALQRLRKTLPKASKNWMNQSWLFQMGAWIRSQTKWRLQVVNRH